MNLKEQQYILKIAETGSLTQAASQLFVTQPALSLCLKNLENSLGTPLFIRVGRRLELTCAGDIYVEKARQMLGLHEAFEQEMSGLLDGHNGRLRVGIRPEFSSAVSSALIRKFINAYPNVSLLWREEMERPLEALLASGEIDLFFSNCHFRRTEFEYIPVFEDELCLIVPHGHKIKERALLSGGRSSSQWVDLSLLSGERFILNHSSQGMRLYADRLLNETNTTPGSLFLIYKTETLIALVADGLGVSLINRRYLNTRQNASRLDVYRVGRPPCRLDFCAAHLAARQLPIYAQTLIRWAAEMGGASSAPPN